MAIRWIFAAAACIGLGACAFAPAPAGNRARDDDGVASAVRREFALRVDEAACLVAHALRLTLRLADPRPYAGGAPATRIDEESFEIGYDRRGAQWLPAARHRLVDRGPGRDVLVQATDELPGYGVRADATIRLRVTAAAESTRALLTGTLPRPLGSRFAATLTSALVARSAPGPAERAASLAREFASAGDLPRARHHRDHALLACDDPVRRARLAADLSMPASARAARRSAKARIGRGDLAAARALQLTAARQDRSPAQDYHLLWQLHHRADNADSAFAAALLLREHERFGRGEELAILELQAQGLADLVERALALDPQYLSRHGVEALPAAAPPR